MESSNPGMVGVGKELKAHPGPILDLGTARAEDWEQFQGFLGLVWVKLRDAAEWKLRKVPGR